MRQFNRTAWLRVSGCARILDSGFESQSVGLSNRVGVIDRRTAWRVKHDCCLLDF